MIVTNPPNVNLSQIVIDADLAMGAHNVTLGAGQTVGGKDISDLVEIALVMLKANYDPDDDKYIDMLEFWNISTALYLQAFSVAGEEAEPQSIFFNPAGTKMYVIGTTGDDVNEYDLSTPWDVSTAVYLQVFSVAAQENEPRSVFFKPDGAKMYIMGTAGNDVNEYDLSTPWDVSTAVYLQVFSAAGQEATCQSVFFNPAGTKMYVMGTTGDDVNEYDLSTPWDVSTAVYLQLFSVAGQETEPLELFFNSVGTKMYVIGTAGDDVNEYDLSTPWDVSTAVYLQVFSIAAQENEPRSVFFKPDGAKMYVIGSTGDDVNEYDLGYFKKNV